MLGTQSGSLLGALVPRVDLYADWVYSWVESYVAAFQIVVAGTRSWIGDAAQGPRAAYRTAMQDLARQRFDSMVVTPTEPGAKLADAVTRMQSVVTDMWADIVAADRERWNAFVARQVTAGAAVERMANPVQAELCAAPPPVVAGLATDPGPAVTAKMAIPTDLYFWRVARPFATRATALTMRVAFGGLWLTGGGIGAGAATGSSALSFGLATAAVWSIDYALNVADAILHRATFERELIGAMALAVAAETASLQGRVDARLQDAFTRLEHCPPVGPQTAGLVSQ